MPFAATWMQLEILTPSRPESERQISYDITYMWNLKLGTNELIYQTETGVEERFIVAKGEGGGRRGGQGLCG